MITKGVNPFANSDAQVQLVSSVTQDDNKKKRQDLPNKHSNASSKNKKIIQPQFRNATTNMQNSSDVDAFERSIEMKDLISGEP